MSAYLQYSCFCMLHFPRLGRLATSLCISYSTKSDIHGIIMNPYNTKASLKYKLLSASHSSKKSFSPHIIPKTKGLKGSLKVMGTRVIWRDILLDLEGS